MIDHKSAAQSQKSMQWEELKQLYDQDFVLWIERTTEQIRRGEMKNLDWEHLLTEIEDLGREQRNQVESYLIRLFVTCYGSIGGHKLTKSFSGKRLN